MARSLAVIVASLLALPRAFAQPGAAGPESVSRPPVIDLVTMGIGALIWERHGHIALCVTKHGLGDALSQRVPRKDDRCYNYGIGDFHEPIKMTWGFFRGANSFWVGKDTPQNMLQVYLYFDRTIWVQTLPL